MGNKSILKTYLVMSVILLGFSCPVGFAAPPVLEVSPTYLEFTANEGGANPAVQILSIWRGGGNGPLNWEVIEDCNWIVVEPNSGKSMGEVDDVNVIVDISGLSAGLYICELTVDAGSAVNSPQTVQVSLHVYTEGELHVPTEYSTIQAAVDAAVDGDVVIVDPCTYTGPGNRDIDFNGLAITVRSTNPNDPCVVAATVIDCQGSDIEPHRGFYFHNGEGPNSIVCGLTITGGKTQLGGGIYCVGSSPRIENCVIANNICTMLEDWLEDSSKGGGIYCTSGSSPSIIGCTISDNTVTGMQGDTLTRAHSRGGGIYCELASSPFIRDCNIVNNTAQGELTAMGECGNSYGAGIYCTSESNPSIIGSIISNNRAEAAGGGDLWPGGRSYGAGICCISGSSPLIIDCNVSNNIAEAGTAGRVGMTGGSGYGGGIYCSSNSQARIENCAIARNQCLGGHGGESGSGVGGDGGAAYGGGICYSPVGQLIKNCIIIDNLSKGGNGGSTMGGGGDGGSAYGGGIYCGATSVNNCTIINNTATYGNGGVPGGMDGSSAGDGIKGSGSTTIINCILWGNGDDLYGCPATYSCIEDGDAGTGNIFADPCFVTGPQGNYYLSQTAAGQDINSLCVDAGSDTAANLGMIFTTRTDQMPDEGIIDMGYHYSENIADLDDDGDVDLVDYAILAAQWQQAPSVPSADISPPGGNGIVDINDLALLLDNWLWGK